MDNDVWVFLDCSVYLLVDTSFSSNNQCSVIYPRIQACSRILHPNKTIPFWLLLEWQVFIEQMHCFCHCAVQDIALSLHCHCKCLLIVQVRILPKTTSLSIFQCHSPTLTSATHPNHSFFHRTHFSINHFKMSFCDEENLQEHISTYCKISLRALFTFDVTLLLGCNANWTCLLTNISFPLKIET